MLIRELGLGAAITAAYCSFLLGSAEDGTPTYAGPLWVGLLVAFLVGMPLAVRLRHPLPVLALVTVASLTASWLDITREPFVAIAFALYAVARLTSLLPAVIALTITLTAVVIGLYATTVVITPSETVAEFTGLTLAIVLIHSGAWLGGMLVRRKHLHAQELRAADDRRIRVEERLRIARDMHDVVSHSLSLIAVQAGIANHVARTHPQRAAEAMQEVENTSRDALREMRSMLGVLRTESSTTDAPLQPVPGLAAIDTLVERARATGLPVRFDRTGDGIAPAGVQATAYRIVQEALTNVIKHAAGSTCAVLIDVCPDVIHLEVTNDQATPRALPSGGHGLAGMRERTHLYGGTFSAGRSPEGGYRVAVDLPYDGSDKRDHPSADRR